MITKTITEVTPSEPTVVSYVNFTAWPFKDLAITVSDDVDLITVEGKLKAEGPIVLDRVYPLLVTLSDGRTTVTCRRNLATYMDRIGQEIPEGFLPE